MGRSFCCDVHVCACVYCVGVETTGAIQMQAMVIDELLQLLGNEFMLHMVNSKGILV